MKRSALTRRTPLARTGRVNPKRTKPRRVSVARDPAYLAAVRSLDYCSAACLPGHKGCHGPIQAAHMGKRNGMGSKGSDHETAPLCAFDHVYQEMDVGPFKGWTDEQMLVWGAWQVLRARDAIEWKRANTIGRRTEGATP